MHCLHFSIWETEAEKLCSKDICRRGRNGANAHEIQSIAVTSKTSSPLKHFALYTLKSMHLDLLKLSDQANLWWPKKKLIFLAQHREKLMQNISESNRNISGVKLLAADEHPPWHGRQRMVATWACASRQPQRGPLVHPAAVATSQGEVCSNSVNTEICFSKEQVGKKKPTLTVHARNKHHYEPNFQYWLEFFSTTCIF